MAKVTLKMTDRLNFSMKDGQLNFVLQEDEAGDQYGDLHNILQHLLYPAEMVECRKDEVASVDFIDLINSLGCVKEGFHDDVEVECTLSFTRKKGEQTGDEEKLGPEILLECGSEEELEANAKKRREEKKDA